MAISNARLLSIHTPSMHFYHIILSKGNAIQWIASKKSKIDCVPNRSWGTVAKRIGGQRIFCHFPPLSFPLHSTTIHNARQTSLSSLLTDLGDASSSKHGLNTMAVLQRRCNYVAHTTAERSLRLRCSCCTCNPRAILYGGAG